MTDNKPIFPDWLDDYLARDDFIMNRFVGWLKDGKSDADIARLVEQTEDKFHSWRCWWSIYREDECQGCGCREYDWDEKKCPNNRCITNWVLPEHKRKKR